MKALKKTAAFLALLAMIIGVGSARASAVGNITVEQVTVKYEQTMAREVLGHVNGLRTGGSWQYNENNEKITVPAREALTYDYTLEAIAMQRAAELALMGDNLSHTRPDGTLCFTAFTGDWIAKGENIAYGYTSAASVYKAWLEEDCNYAGQGHRRNMQSGDFTAIGMGCVYYNGYYYWAMELGTPSGEINTSDPGAVNEERTVDVEVLDSENNGEEGTATPGESTATPGESTATPDGDANNNSNNNSSNSNGNSSSCDSQYDEDDDSSGDAMEYLEELIQTAAPQSVITITKEQGINTLSNGVMRMLAQNDVTLVMEYTYQNEDYRIVIPAGKAVDSDIPWYGPLYLAAHFSNGTVPAAGKGDSTAAVAGQGDYTVKAGDTLSSIARANGMTVKQIVAQNPQIKNVNLIYVGQRITLK